MRLVREAEETCGQDKHALVEVYLGVLKVDDPTDGLRHDQFRDVSVKCMRVLCQFDPARARALQESLGARAYGGPPDARIYEARASMEEQLGDTQAALDALREGLRLGAQPRSILQKVLQRLQPGFVQPLGPESHRVLQRLQPGLAQALGPEPPPVLQRLQHGNAQRLGPEPPQDLQRLQPGPARPPGVDPAGGAQPGCGSERCQRAGAPSCRMPPAAAATDLAEEVRTAQRSVLEQCRQLQEELSQAVEGLRADVRVLRRSLTPGDGPGDDRCPNSHSCPRCCRESDEGTPRHSLAPGGGPGDDGCRKAHSCPRCCRESVEGAVEVLMDSVLCAVHDEFKIEVEALRAGTWQALADEVWETISVVRPPRAPAPQRPQTRGTWPRGVQALSALLPFGELLKRDGAAWRRVPNSRGGHHAQAAAPAAPPGTPGPAAAAGEPGPGRAGGDAWRPALAQIQPAAGQEEPMAEKLHAPPGPLSAGAYKENWAPPP